MLNEIKELRTEMHSLESEQLTLYKSLYETFLTERTHKAILSDIADLDRYIRMLRSDIEELKHECIWLSIERQRVKIC